MDERAGAPIRRPTRCIAGHSLEMTPAHGLAVENGAPRARLVAVGPSTERRPARSPQRTPVSGVYRDGGPIRERNRSRCGLCAAILAMGLVGLCRLWGPCRTCGRVRRALGKTSGCFLEGAPKMTTVTRRDTSDRVAQGCRDVPGATQAGCGTALSRRSTGAVERGPARPRRRPGPTTAESSPVRGRSVRRTPSLA